MSAERNTNVLLGEAPPAWDRLVSRMGAKGRIADALRLIRPQTFVAGVRVLWQQRRFRRDYSRVCDSAHAAIASTSSELLASLGGRARLISIVMPVYNPQPEFFAAAVDSIRLQTYPRWELCIADDASTDSSARRVLERLVSEEPRIRCVFRGTNGHIAAASNSALQLATGEYIALVDQDDLLARDALEHIAAELADDAGVDILFTDEDKLDARGRRFAPYFKHAFNPSLMLGHNFISHLGVYRAKLVRDVGGFSEGLDGSQDYDLALRCLEWTSMDRVRHVPRVLYHWRAAQGSAAAEHDAKPYAIAAARRALSNHLARRNIAADVEPGMRADSHRLRFHAHSLPSVSIVVLDAESQKNLADWLQIWLVAANMPVFEAILPTGLSRAAARTTIAQARIILAPRSTEQAPHAWVNQAAEQASGELLCFVSAMLERPTHAWLVELAGHASLDSVAISAGRIIDAKALVRHAGYMLKSDGAVFDPCYGFPAAYPGPAAHALLARDCAAASANFLVVRRDDFLSLGGFHIHGSARSGSDVDLCMRVSDAAKRVVWTPYATAVQAMYGGFPTFPLWGAEAEVDGEFRRRWANSDHAARFLNVNVELGQGAFRLAAHAPPHGAPSVDYGARSTRTNLEPAK